MKKNQSIDIISKKKHTNSRQIVAVNYRNQFRQAFEQWLVEISRSKIEATAITSYENKKKERRSAVLGPLKRTIEGQCPRVSICIGIRVYILHIYYTRQRRREYIAEKLAGENYDNGLLCPLILGSLCIMYSLLLSLCSWQTMLYARPFHPISLGLFFSPHISPPTMMPSRVYVKYFIKNLESHVSHSSLSLSYTLLLFSTSLIPFLLIDRLWFLL